MDELEGFTDDGADVSAYNACREMHYGRLDWLAEHIRRCDFQISPLVARKILAMLEGAEPECFFGLVAVRRTDLPPNAADPILLLHRDADLALEVARRGGFNRSHLKNACFEVGKLRGLNPDYVAQRVRHLREYALHALAEETGLEAYLDKTKVLDV